MRVFCAYPKNILRHLPAMRSGTCLHQTHAEPLFYKCQGEVEDYSSREKLELKLCQCCVGAACSALLKQHAMLQK